jgi:hypothetical protein
MRRDDDAEFLARLAQGNIYERAVGRRYQRRGLRVLPSYSYSGGDDDERKAPGLHALCETESLVVPDLLVCGGGRTFWTEVKFKSRTNVYRKTGRVETGFGLRLWRHYRQVQKESGQPVCVLCVHRAECEVRGDWADKLAEHAREFPGNQKMPPMVFFDWNLMRHVCTFTELMEGSEETSTPGVLPSHATATA